MKDYLIWKKFTTIFPMFIRFQEISRTTMFFIFILQKLLNLEKNSVLSFQCSLFPKKSSEQTLFFIFFIFYLQLLIKAMRSLPLHQLTILFSFAFAKRKRLLQNLTEDITETHYVFVNFDKTNHVRLPSLRGIIQFKRLKLSSRMIM